MIILISGLLVITSRKPFARSMAGADPTVPTNSATPALPPVSFTTSLAALLPSSMKSEPRKHLYNESSETFTAAVRQHDRDSCFLGFLQNRFKTGFDHRGESDHVDTLGDKRSDSFDLVLLFLLSIRKTQIDAAFSGLGFYSVGICGFPISFSAHPAID